MSPGWLTVTAVLAASLSPGTAARDTLTFTPTCKVISHPEVELKLHCGDRKNSGVVQHWHTPFGDLQTPGVHSDLQPVFMDRDGSLVVPSTSSVHAGLYYCLLRHTEGTTLWPYELHVGHNDPKRQNHSRHEPAFRSRRDAGPEEEREAGVSDGQFTGAVVASVLLTFVVGFSAGALSRTHVLRCLGAVAKRLPSPRQQRRQNDTTDGRSAVTMVTVVSQALQVDQVSPDDSVTCASTSPSPPAKPQRSFRHKREKAKESSVHLEGCDQMEERVQEEEEEEERGRNVEEADKRNDGEEEEEAESRGFYLIGDEGSQTETDEEEKKEESHGDEDGGRGLSCFHLEEEKEDRKENEGGSREEEQKERGGQQSEEDEDGEKTEEDTLRESESPSEDDGGGRTKQEEIMAGVQPSPSAAQPGRRVIRLYQYDESGQRYSHLPDPASEDPVPVPRLKQRSISLTRLNAIMAAASASPLDRKEDSEERPHFNMEI